YALALAELDAEQAQFLERLCEPGSPHQIFVATMNNAIVGFVSFSLHAEKRIGEIGLNAVLPDHAGQGVGTSMYEFAMARMKESGMALATVPYYAHPARVANPSATSCKWWMGRAGRCWGLCRCGHLLTLDVHVRIPALEDGTQLPVERLHARLQQQMRTGFRPLHLLLLAEAFAHHLIHCGLHKTCRDRFSLVIPLPVIRDHVPVVPDIRAQRRERLDQLSEPGICLIEGRDG